MKRSASLVNAARGGIVDEGALIEALARKLVANAALDDLEQDRPAAGYPLLTSARTDLIVTPHVAWRTQVAMQRLVTQLFFFNEYDDPRDLHSFPTRRSSD